MSTTGIFFAGLFVTALCALFLAVTIFEMRRIGREYDESRGVYARGRGDGGP